LWIGGEERKGKYTFNVLDPSDDQVLIAVADATPEDAIAALDAACAVQAEWAATAPRERGEILRAVFEKITERAEDIATLMTLEMGKVLPESMDGAKYGAEFFRWFAEEAVRIAGRYTPSPAGTGRVLVTKQPVGFPLDGHQPNVDAPDEKIFKDRVAEKSRHYLPRTSTESAVIERAGWSDRLATITADIRRPRLTRRLLRRTNLEPRQALSRQDCPTTWIGTLK
jgi:hypothetical protein